MRTLVHLSDIHFGRVDYAVVRPLIDTVRRVGPDVVAISGDLTQRARASQFREAREFLAQLPFPQIVVPGNHDVPFYNIVGRFLGPLDNYRRYINDDPEPFFLDDEIAVLGLNTARSLALKNGRISVEQIARIRERLCAAGDTVVKILVTHHPLDVPREAAGQQVVGRAGQAMAELAACGADLFLAGHYHLSNVGDTAARYAIAGYSGLVVHAGTATSTRARGELNTFNIVRIERPCVRIYRLSWRVETGSFEVFRRERFEKTGSGWLLTEASLTPPDWLEG